MKENFNKKFLIASLVVILFAFLVFGIGLKLAGGFYTSPNLPSGFGSIYNQQEFNFKVIPVLMTSGWLLIVGIALLIFGLYYTNRKKQFEDAIKNGKKTSCKVVSVETYPHSRNHKSSSYLICAYKGESGNSYTTKVYVFQSDLININVGKSIECYVKGEKCFVDNNNLKEVSTQTE